MFSDDLEERLFGGSPSSRLLDILKNTNEHLALEELSRFLKRAAAAEYMLEEKGINEKDIDRYVFENSEKVLRGADSLALSVMSDIVTRNE